MYIVELINDGRSLKVHNASRKLKSGKVVKGINSIDSFTFSILPSNVGFDNIYDLKTLVSVYNTKRKRYEFLGRVLYSRETMEESGLIYKEVTCESYFGFLCDSKQRYVVEQNWTVIGLLEHIINEHNSQIEDYKQFSIGEVTVTDSNDNLYVGIQRENTWKTIEEKLIGKLGGEIRFRVVDGVNYIDYLTVIGETKATPIQLSVNMKAIAKESNATAYVTRLIPLGAKLIDEDGNESEERIDITSVNDGVDYIESEDVKNTYGIRVEVVEFDDITTPSALLKKGKEWLAENNKLPVKYSITALDLSLLGLDIDDFEVHNKYPIKNYLLNIDDTARIIKKNIDVCEEIKSTIEVGDNFKTLSEIQREQTIKLNDLLKNTNKLKGDKGADGEDATTLRIDSSRGTVFKNNTVSTVLSAVIYKGSKRITDITALKEEYGANAYLEWKWQRMGEETFGTIVSTDSRIGNDGFTFTLSPEDVDTKVVFLCNLIAD